MSLIISSAVPCWQEKSRCQREYRTGMYIHRSPPHLSQPSIKSKTALRHTPQPFLTFYANCSSGETTRRLLFASPGARSPLAPQKGGFVSHTLGRCRRIRCLAIYGKRFAARRPGMRQRLEYELLFPTLAMLGSRPSAAECPGYDDPGQIVGQHVMPSRWRPSADASSGSASPPSSS